MHADQPIDEHWNGKGHLMPDAKPVVMNVEGSTQWAVEQGMARHAPDPLPPTPSSMVERVARAIYSALGNDQFCTWDRALAIRQEQGWNGLSLNQIHATEAATAAIEATGYAELLEVAPAFDADKARAAFLIRIGVAGRRLINLDDALLAAFRAAQQ